MGDAEGLDAAAETLDEVGRGGAVAVGPQAAGEMRAAGIVLLAVSGSVGVL